MFCKLDTAVIGRGPLLTVWVAPLNPFRRSSPPFQTESPKPSTTGCSPWALTPRAVCPSPSAPRPLPRLTYQSTGVIRPLTGFKGANRDQRSHGYWQALWPLVVLACPFRPPRSTTSPTSGGTGTMILTSHCRAESSSPPAHSRPSQTRRRADRSGGCPAVPLLGGRLSGGNARQDERVPRNSR